ncbi:hypothetical protein TCAP_06130 [Tolypocladium capitatum]|uniref:Uncharacterized protein n=1 Tax=Tolypocladium capitatum TaxID=45235 RepID=A0A2K3Q8Y3_9HYPO|nr:hypothetical protein TCAP_06130 [Tolypocladium capitatum]
MPSRRQGTQASQAAASQSSDTADSTRSLRTAWSPDQELRLLELILEAKRDGQLVSKKATFRMSSLAGPGISGCLKISIANYETSGGRSRMRQDHRAKIIRTSRANARSARKTRHCLSEAIYKKVDRGLLRRVGDFDFAEWYEVFLDN